MNLESEKKTLGKAIELWGIETQTGMFHEEVGELMQAINKHKRNPNAETLDHLTEELTDVKILIGQIEQTLDPVRLNFWLAFKLERLSHRIKKTIKEREENYEKAKAGAGHRQNLFGTLHDLGIIALDGEMDEIMEAIKRDEVESLEK
ncbi:NTP-PPase [Flavobacterium sp. phage 1/32]|nr:NTP-PPase [Flavobacterium sp. phage 1/32]